MPDEFEIANTEKLIRQRDRAFREFEQGLGVSWDRVMPEERWDKIQSTLDYVATLQRSHDQQIGKLVEQGDRNERLIAQLTERTIQAMDAINRLANIAATHEDRISDLKNPPH